MSRTILVVDDNVGVLEGTERLLKSRGFNVLLAESGRSALRVMEREDVHLVISDIHLLDLPGLDLFAHLRRIGNNVPVIFVSGDLGLDTVDDALSVSNSSFLPKPFTADELFAAVATSVR